MQVFLALGSNSGDREAALIKAKDLLMKNGVMIVLQSSVLVTPAFSSDELLSGVCRASAGDSDSPAGDDFLNQVLECETDLGPIPLLKTCQSVEKEMGRNMCEKGSGKPRIIDIDILFYGNKKLVLPGLSIPHPGVKKRYFWREALSELGASFFLA